MKLSETSMILLLLLHRRRRFQAVRMDMDPEQLSGPDSGFRVRVVEEFGFLLLLRRRNILV